MKVLLSLLISLFALVATAQQGTFNFGWGTRPQRIFCTGTTLLISADASPANNTGKLIVKLRKTAQGYEVKGRVTISDTIIGYSFFGGKLNLLCVNRKDCDYWPMDTFFTQVDTATMRITKHIGTSAFPPHRHISIQNDSSLFLVGDILEPSYLMNFNFNVVDSIESLAFNTLFVQTLKNGKMLLQQMSYDLLLYHLDEFAPPLFGSPVDSSYYPYFKIRANTLPPIQQVYEYSSDSLLLLCNDTLFKADTSLNQFKAYPLPAHNRFNFHGTTYSLLTTSEIKHYSLANHNLLKVDVLNAPPRVKLAQASYQGQDTTYLFYSNVHMALNETILTNSLQWNTGLSDLQLDSLSIDSVVFMGQNNFDRKVHFSVSVQNTGVDTIHGFNLLYSDKPQYDLCQHLQYRSYHTVVPPAASVVIKEIAQFWGAGQLCAYLSALNHTFEANLTNNTACNRVPLSISAERFPVLKIFPNPAIHTFKIESESALTKLEMTDLAGRQIPVEWLQISEHTFRVDVGILGRGIYLLKIEDKEGRAFSSKVLVEK